MSSKQEPQSAASSYLRDQRGRLRLHVSTLSVIFFKTVRSTRIKGVQGFFYISNHNYGFWQMASIHVVCLHLNKCMVAEVFWSCPTCFGRFVADAASCSAALTLLVTLPELK